jgi:AcrR family transcriptional regulator
VTDGPSWPRSTRAARRRTLSQEQIVDTALALLGRGSLDEVSMRRVAQELNTGAASLYAHVANKDELHELMLDRLLGRIDVPEPDPRHWRRQMRELANAQFAVLTSYPGIARVGMETTIPTGPNALRLAEGSLAILRAGGLSDRDAALAFDTVALQVSALAVEASADAGAEIAQRSAEIGEYMAARAADFPNLLAVGRHLGDATTAERVDFAVDGLLAGLSPGPVPTSDS